MPKQRSIAEARNDLPQLIREAEAGEAIELTRRGESVAILLGLRQYERLTAGTRRFSEAWRQFADTHDLAELEIDPDEVFAETRDRIAGRDVKL